MLTEFAPLSPEETARMFDAIPYITILVAAADDDMDEVELAAAQHLADVRSYNNYGKLTAFYETIDEGLTDRIKELYRALPGNGEERQAILSAKLSRLNAIIAKLESPYDYYYYDTFKSFAHHIAESHGGFLRFMTVGPQEAKVVDLPMIEPIPKPEDNRDLV